MEGLYRKFSNYHKFCGYYSLSNWRKVTQGLTYCMKTRTVWVRLAYVVRKHITCKGKGRDMLEGSPWQMKWMCKRDELSNGWQILAPCALKLQVFYCVLNMSCFTCLLICMRAHCPWRQGPKASRRLTINGGGAPFSEPCI